MDRSSRLVIAVLGVPTLTIGTDFTGALMLVLPIEKEFGVDITTTQWVLNIYALTFAMGMVAAGRLADMYGRRRLMLIGLVIFLVGSLGCALAPGIAWLIGARAVQGIGSSIIWPCVLGLASTSVRDDERGFAIGLIIGIIASGNVIGPILSGIVAGLGEWRLFYVANFVLATASLVLVPRLIPRDSVDGRDEGIDYLGMTVLSLAILGLLYALDIGPVWGWTSVRTMMLLVVSVALFAAFPWIERRVQDALVPPPMMRNRQFLLALSANGLMVPSIFLLFLYLPQYLHKVLGWSVLASSVGTLPAMVSVAATSVISGRFYNSVGPRRLLTVGYGLTAIGALVTTFVSPDWGYVGLVPIMLLIGIGAAISVSASGSAAVGAADPSRASLAGALSFMFHLAFGAIGVGAGTAILSGVSAVRLDTVLQSIGVAMSTAERATLNGAAPTAESVRHILDAYPPEIAVHIVGAMRDAFVAGLNQAYWLVFVLAVIGVLVALRIRDDELSNVDT